MIDLNKYINFNLSSMESINNNRLTITKNLSNKNKHLQLPEKVITKQ